METYDFYNLKYGVKLSLILDENEEELRYQCTSIKDEYRNKFHYKCRNKWRIVSYSVIGIWFRAKCLFLCGEATGMDDDTITISSHGYYILHGNGVKIRDRFPIQGNDLVLAYYELIDALEELGNDLDQGQLFLEM